ncbi:Fosfomycin resistance protein FosA [hydrothermal vent metagenome]|uniref:Fosfomycin resistance protein FosA n=1 Tax=hydrothermal vent metagenome TaxID=652676 RepID=A0A3B0TMV4_9ZZZZ
MSPAKVRGLNHVTLAVSGLDRAVAFYRDVLGFELRKAWPGGAYLEAGDFWLCLSPDAQTRTAPHPDYTHLAFDVAEDEFAHLCAAVEKSAATIWKDNKSEGASLYFLDPDGHKLELHAGTLATRLDAMEAG